MDGILEKIGHMAQSAAYRLHVRSALNPMLWLCGITSPLLLTFAYWFRDIEQIMYWLVAAAILPIGFTCLGFVFFALFKPEKLQSEDYQIRHESLQIIQQKAGRKSFTASAIEAIANPDVPRLTDGRDG